MTKTIAVFGVGPGLGRSVARRYAHGGWDVALVARNEGRLERLAAELSVMRVRTVSLAFDLEDTAGVPALVAQVRDLIGEIDAIYYAPTPTGGFVSASELTVDAASDFMPLALYSLIALVREFVPHMVDQGDGAILTAQGASAVQGIPGLSGPGPAQAAQRNYLQSLHDELADRGVYVGMLYIGATIENSAFHASLQDSDGGGSWGPIVSPDVLAERLWHMHSNRQDAEVSFPER